MQAETGSKICLFRNVVEQFVPLSDEEWLIFQDHLQLLTLKKKEYFARPAAVCNHIGLIISGSVRYFHVKDGNEITGFFSVENEMVSSYKSFLTRQPAMNYIEALEKTEIVTLSYTGLQTLLTNDNLGCKMERFGRLVAEYLCCCYEDRINSFIIQSPEERYMDLLARSSGIIRRIPQHYIANFLGITPVSLSRIRRRIMAPSSDIEKLVR